MLQKLKVLWRHYVRGLTVLNIDPFDSQFPPAETHAILHLMSKYDQYVIQGRLLEAQGVRRSIDIVYACFKSDYQDSKTDLGELSTKE